jgi:hypothetical protein
MHIYIHTYFDMHTYMHTYMLIRTYTCACIHTHTHIQAYMHTYIHTYMHTHIHTYIHRCTAKCYVHILRSLLFSLSVLHNVAFNSLRQQEITCPPKLINRNWRLLCFLCEGNVGFFFGCKVIWTWSYYLISILCEIKNNWRCTFSPTYGYAFIVYSDSFNIQFCFQLLSSL